MTTEESLWEFAIRIYAHPGVETVCLELQDAFGADVLVLIYGLWAGARGLRLSFAELDAVSSAVAPWQEGAVAPLRAIRRALKGPPKFSPGFDAAVRTIMIRVKYLELEAEKCELEFLETLKFGVPGEGGGRATAANLMTYLKFLDISPRRFSREKRDLLVVAAG